LYGQQGWAVVLQAPLVWWLMWLNDGRLLLFHSGRTRVVFVVSENVSVSRFLFRYVPPVVCHSSLDLWLGKCWVLVVGDSSRCQLVRSPCCVQVFS
jgi:hypothetical protein